MGVPDELRSISLLWPDNEKKDNSSKKANLSETSFVDANLEGIAAEFAADKKYTSYVKGIFSEMCTDIDVINYRLDTIEDILNSSQIQEALGSIYAIASEVERTMLLPESLESPEVMRLIKNFKETDLFGSSLNKARKIMLESGGSFKSKGLCRLRDEIIRVSEGFLRVNEDNVSKPDDDCFKPASITLGINLDSHLRPVEATVVSLNKQKYTRAPFLNRVIPNNKNAFESIYDIHSGSEGFLSDNILKELEEASESMIKIDSTALQLSLLSDLYSMIKNTSVPLRYILRRYINTYSAFFVNLKYELLFILGTVGLIERLRALGLPMCRPVIEDQDRKAFDVKGLYNMNLALNWDEKKVCKIVKNDIYFNADENIFILTGPNSGGKTTYVRALAQIQILCQAGMYVPAGSAYISPVDNVYTHFSSEEKKDTDYGRLGEEAKRLNEIFKQATKYCLILLNESLASTSPGECLYMSRDILYGLKLLNAHAVFATHQHELAANLEEENISRPGDGRFASLVAGVEKRKDIPSGSAGDCFRRTYRVVQAPPMGTSYARDIAESFGISYEQIKQLLSARMQE